MDSGSVPVGYLVFESKVTTLGAMGDLAKNIIRPLVQKFVPGTVAISPFGPNMRSIVINVDPQKLLDYNLTPQHVIDALATGNAVIPAGNVYIKDSMPVVANNATVVDIQKLGDIPLRMERNVYLRDVATIHDDVDITYGYALVNGKKSVYLPIIKKDTGSTLTVVADVHKAMQKFRDAVPKDVTINFEFDESPTVVAAVESVASEGMIGAADRADDPAVPPRPEERGRRRVQHPAGADGVVMRALGDGQHDQRHVAGRHGAGDRHPGRRGDGDDRERARADGANAEHRHGGAVGASNATAVPRLLALLCILSVFIPAFMMTDPLRSLFMPLTLAVGFAMISSYLLSSMLVPILCVALLKHRGGGMARGSPGCSTGCSRSTARRWAGSRPAALADRADLSRGVRPGPLGAGLAGRHRAVPPGGFGGIRAPVPAAARLELRADPADGDRRIASRRSSARRSPSTSRSRWATWARRAELRHQQHGPVHARARRRPVAGPR